MNYLDKISKEAEAIGAVNCIQCTANQLIGYNTDWSGFQKMLLDENIQVEDKHCTLIGAGGAAQGVLYALLQFPIQSLYIVNRSLFES